VLEKLGVDRVLIPECEFAGRLARSLSAHNVLDYIELSEEYGILEVPAPRSWVGKTILELNVRAKLGVNIIAVESGDVTNVSPSADYRILDGDVMVVLGDNYSLEAVQKL
jgi:trk system potassium uptake protein TrkA